MKDIINHIKKVAIADFPDFFAPFVSVIRAMRLFTSTVSSWVKRSIDKRKKANEQ